MLIPFKAFPSFKMVEFTHTKWHIFYQLFLVLEKMAVSNGVVTSCVAGSAWSGAPIALSPFKTEVVKYVNETYIVSCQSERGVHVMWTRPSGEQVTQAKGRSVFTWSSCSVITC